jgi:hypothetical protein
MEYLGFCMKGCRDVVATDSKGAIYEGRNEG